jgi:hypothetical protein
MVQNIHALPNTAQTIAPRALPFNLAPADTKGGAMAIAVSVMCTSISYYAQVCAEITRCLLKSVIRYTKHRTLLPCPAGHSLH